MGDLKRNLMKKIIMLLSLTMLIMGCDNKPATGTDTQVKTEEVKSKAQLEKLTEKEIEDLEALKESPSEETANKAGYYLSNLEVTPVGEIRKFIAKGWAEWEEINKFEAEQDFQTESDQSEASMVILP